MKKRTPPFIAAAVAVLVVFLTDIAPAQSPEWSHWTPLIGTWQGEGEGTPGKGGGTFSFNFDLDKNILVRKSHSEYAGKDASKMVSHDDLMIVYAEGGAPPARAIYFDNEGHTIRYAIEYGDRRIVLLADAAPGRPVFRLIYSMIDADTVDTLFEMSKDGKEFKTYIQGKSRRVK
jgi:hypothetical protein